jgi:hypothetical protein
MCITGALRRGSLVIPSTQAIARDLVVIEESGSRRAINARVQELWEDLRWMSQEDLLFHEVRYEQDEFFRSLAQRNVNERVKHFHPGFVHGGRERRLILNEVIDKSITALRLVVLKDMYFFGNFELAQREAGEFLVAEHLVPDADRYFTFLQTVHAIGYMDFNPPGGWELPRDGDKAFVLEPTQRFRNLDMYLELRALDHFAAHGADRTERRRCRLALHEKAAAQMRSLGR